MVNLIRPRNFLNFTYENNSTSKSSKYVGFSWSQTDLLSIIHQGTGLTSFLAWIGNHIHHKVWDAITYPFLNFGNGQVILPHTSQIMWLLILFDKINRGISVSTVEYRYTRVQYNMILHTSHQWLGQIYISVLIHKRHPISRTSGRAMGCLLWGVWMKSTML